MRRGKTPVGWILNRAKADVIHNISAQVRVLHSVEGTRVRSSEEDMDENTKTDFVVGESVIGDGSTVGDKYGKEI